MLLTYLRYHLEIMLLHPIVIQQWILVEGIQLHAAVEWIQNQRPIIAPNDGFKLQLAKFEVKIFLSSSIVRSNKRRWSNYDLNKLKQKWKSIEISLQQM